jgi:hypothetical protein
MIKIKNEMIGFLNVSSYQFISVGVQLKRTGKNEEQWGMRPKFVVSLKKAEFLSRLNTNEIKFKSDLR